jgi:hypothetical protein
MMPKLYWTTQRGPYLLDEYKVTTVMTYAHRTIIKKWVDAWPKADQKKIGKIPVLRFNDQYGQQWVYDNDYIPTHIEGIESDIFPPVEEPLRDEQQNLLAPIFKNQEDAFAALLEAAIKLTGVERLLNSKTEGVYMDPFCDTSHGILAVAAASMAGTAIACSFSPDPSPVTVFYAHRLGVKLEVVKS